MFVSGIGFVFFNYGRKKTRPLFLIFGAAMMIYPYFITDFLWMTGIAVFLTAVLYWLKKRGF
jgi:hypothetical protein